MSRLLYNLKETPFSTCGSALAILKTHPNDSIDCKDEGYYLRALYEDDRNRLLFRLTFDGSFEGMTDEYYEQDLRLRKGERSIELCMPQNDAIRFHGFCDRFELHMSEAEIIKYNAAMFLDEKHIGLNCYTRKEIIYVLKGSAELDAPWGDNESNSYIRVILHPDANGEMDFVFKEFRTEFVKDYLTTAFDEDRKRLVEAFDAFANGFDGCKPRSETYRRALYTIWNNRVAPNQLITRDTVLSGKGSACEINSFDNAFITAALASAYADQAMTQFMSFAAEQDCSGACPAWIGSYKIQNRYVLPPVDGIALRGRFNNPKYECTICEKLMHEVEFWMTYRRYGKKELPTYRHPDECAIANCSCFDGTPYLIAPDLIAYIIVAIDSIIDLSVSTRREDEIEEYVVLRNELLTELIEQCYDDSTGRFLVLSGFDGTPTSYDGLLCYLPIMIGRRLPDRMAKNLHDTMLNHHNTRFGVPQDGEGRIRPAMILLLIIGLQDAGLITEAKALARSCYNLIKTFGFAESFDADRGDPIGERSSSVTAAVFMLLENEYQNGVLQ